VNSYSGYCPVTQYGPHLATRKSGYCEPHHVQYTQEKRRWHSSKNNYHRKTTPNDPGPWTSRYATINWVPVQIQPNPEAIAATPPDNYSQAPNTAPTSTSQQPVADECAVTLDADARRHLVLLAKSIEVNLNSLADKATYDELDFSRRWAAHVEDRVEAIQLAALALRELARCSPPSTHKKPRN
jgi:hypothetical protein